MSPTGNCQLFSIGPAGPRLQRAVVASLGSERGADPGIMGPGVQDIHTHSFFCLFLLVCVCVFMTACVPP